MAARWGGKAAVAGMALCLVPGAGVAQAGSPAASPAAPSPPAVQPQVPEPLAARVAGWPAPVRAFVKRRLECNHWGGEEPYSKARARQIAQAAQRAGCDRLDRDEARLRQRYRANAALPALLDAVRDAWEL